MRKARQVALLAGLVLVAGLALWLVSRIAGDPSEPSSVRSAGTVQDPADVPKVAADDAAVPQALVAAALADSTPVVQAESPAAAEADQPPSFPFDGRVVDDLGVPMAGATVIFWPNAVTSESYGLEDSMWSDRSELDKLPRAQTGADGRFEVQGRHISGLDNRGMFNDPVLVVVAAGYAIRCRICEGYAGGAYDAGDVALEPEAWLAGRVVDARGLPIAGATVKPWNPRSRSVRGIAAQDESFDLLTGVFAAAVSGDDGRFHAGGLWEGKVQVGFSADGYLDRWFDDYVPVTAGRPTDMGDIELDAGAAVAGLVLDDTGAPVAGARVWVDSPQNFESPWDRRSDTVVPFLVAKSEEEGVRTDAEGRFLVSALARINHSVLVDAEGWEPARIDNVLPGGASVGVKLVRPATLRLLVTSRKTAQPLPDAQARALRYPDQQGSSRALELSVTPGDDPGALVVTRLGQVRTKLVVSAPGHASTTLDLEGVVPPAHVDRTVALVPESVLAGHVRGDDGAAIPEAELVLRSTERGKSERTVVHADEQGQYEVRGLAVGEWQLTADAPDRSPVARRERLEEGESRADVDFILPRSASVFGTCYSDDGTLEVGVEKTFQHVEEGVPRSTSLEARADASGHYELLDVPVGDWKVLGNPTREFSLAAGERLQLDLREDPEATLEGRVLRADGTPVADAWVSVIATNLGKHAYLHKFMNRTDDRGHWSWKPARTGRLEVVGSLPNGGGTTGRLIVDLLDGERRSVDLHVGEGRVAGRVTEQDGKPVAGATVHMLPVSDGDEPLTWTSMSVGGEPFEFGVATDADGRFELGHLAPGRYHADVIAKGERAEDQPPFALSENESIELLITVTRTGRIAGRVELASGVPVHEGTYLLAVGPGDEEQSASIETGRYELTGLRPGTWRLSVLDGRDVVVERSINLAAGQDLEVDLVIVQ